MINNPTQIDKNKKMFNRKTTHSWNASRNIWMSIFVRVELPVVI